MKSQETILILGGSGLLGHHCYEQLKMDFNVIQTYNSHISDKTNSEFFSIEQKSKLENIFLRYKPKAIINTIALVTVDGCELNPKKAKVMNSEFVSYLVDMMKKTGLSDSHLLQISSASIYGIKEEGDIKPWVETDDTKPISVYANTKLDGELSARKHQGPLTILRTDFYGINPLSEKSLLWWIINRATNGEVMDGWENIHFSPVSATKLANILAQIIQNNIEGVFNAGCKNACNKYDFAKTVCDLINIQGKVKKTRLLQDKELIRPDYTVLNSTKLNALIDMNFSWQEDLSIYMKNLPKLPKNLSIKLN